MAIGNGTNGDTSGSLSLTNLWVAGVVHTGNTSAFPSNPPGVEPDAWFYVSNKETRIAPPGQYIGETHMYTLAPSGPAGSSNYLAFLAETLTTGNTQPIAEVVCQFLEVGNNGSGLVSTVIGQFVLAYNSGSGGTTACTGCKWEVLNLAGTGGIVTQTGLDIVTGNATASSAVGTDYSILIDSPLASGLISAHYGLYIDDQTGGGANNPNPWAIYSNGGKSYFKGSLFTSGVLGIGATSTPDSGISRLGSASLAIGNGTNGDFSGSLKTTIINSVTGYQVNGAATSGNYLRGNGTNFVSSAIQAGDLPAGTGTVTSFSAGNLSPLFTTSVATATTTPALTFALSNAAGGTVFGNATASAAAPGYTIAPVLGIPGISTGSITIASSTASGNYTITAPANAATPTLTLPTTSNVLAGQFAGDNVLYSNTPVGATAAGTLVLPTLSTQTANFVFAGPTSAGPSAPTFRALVAADIPSSANLPLWSNLQNSAADLTLANAGFKTTFNQTSNIAWLWANTTVATSGTTNATPLLELAANYWTGAASATDTWTIGASLAAGTNGASTLSITHSGSTGIAVVAAPRLYLNGFTAITSKATPLGIKIDSNTGVGFIVENTSTEYTDFISGGSLKGLRGFGSVPMVIGTGDAASYLTVYSGTGVVYIGNAGQMGNNEAALQAKIYGFAADSTSAIATDAGISRLGAASPGNWQRYCFGYHR